MRILCRLGVVIAPAAILVWSGCGDDDAAEPTSPELDADAGDGAPVGDAGATDAALVRIVCPPGPADSENDVIKPLQHDGQTFVVWKDRAEGDAGSDIRYNVYRALEPITEQNLGAAVLVAKGVLNNSGKLFGTAFNAAQRIDLTPAAPPYEQPAGMTVIAQDAAPLPPWSGLFVHTAKEEACAYYAVVATDLAGEPSERIVPGENATTAPVAEHVEPIKPIKLYDSAKRGIYSRQTEVTGKKRLPLRVLLHASEAQGGGAGEYGDYYLYYANQDMGYVDGMPGVFSVEETHNSKTYLMMRNRDAIVTPSGRSLETYWFGYQCVPDWAPTRAPRAYPFTEQRLLWMIGEVVSRYGADPESVSCHGGSMGAWGTTSFAFRHPEVFASVYPDRPRTRQIGLPSLVAKPAAAQAVMSDGTTPYLERMDSVKFAAEHHEDLPFYAWDVGRNDGFASWPEQVDMVAALTASHHGFAFMWNNDNHSGAGDIAAAMLEMYPPEKFGIHRSYPAFSHSSIDDDLGDGSPASGALAGGINLGFDWSAVSDEPNRWSASITNSLAKGAMTVDVTPRRCQKFRLNPGDAVGFTTSAGASGTVHADAWGLVTVPQVAIAKGGATVLTLTR